MLPFPIVYIKVFKGFLKSTHLQKLKLNKRILKDKHVFY